MGKIPDTIQIVMNDREAHLLHLLATTLNTSKSAILLECAKRSIENKGVK
jgi:hypothetical protein